MDVIILRVIIDIVVLKILFIFFRKIFSCLVLEELIVLRNLNMCDNFLWVEVINYWVNFGLYDLIIILCFWLEVKIDMGLNCGKLIVYMFVCED